jgi:hypothetical protein
MLNAPPVLTDFNGREETKNNYISTLPKYMYDVQSSFLTAPMWDANVNIFKVSAVF